MRLASPFLRPTHELERDGRLDRLTSRLTRLAERVGHGPAGPALRGEWLGHALHPMLTDLPIGCWTSAGVLDLVGGAGSRGAARRLVGLGVAMVPVTAAAGMADYAQIDEPRSRRVGAVHAVGNVLVAWLYLMSWRHRRKGRHFVGVVLSMLGGALLVATGYLGGHLAYGQPSGTDDGSSTDPGADQDPEALFGAHDTGDIMAAAESDLS